MASAPRNDKGGTVLNPELVAVPDGRRKTLSITLGDVSGTSGFRDESGEPDRFGQCGRTGRDFGSFRDPFDRGQRIGGAMLVSIGRVEGFSFRPGGFGVTAPIGSIRLLHAHGGAADPASDQKDREKKRRRPSFLLEKTGIHRPECSESILPGQPSAARRAIKQMNPPDTPEKSFHFFRLTLYRGTGTTVAPTSHSA